MHNRSVKQMQIIHARVAAFVDLFLTGISTRIRRLNYSQALQIASGVIASALLVCAAPLHAQQSGTPAKPAASAPQQNPLSAFTKGANGAVTYILLSSAQKMPEENYNFKPTDTVRSFGQIVGHVADAQYMFCSVALGEKNPAPNVEQTKSSKGDLIAALKDAFAYCGKAYDGMTDASGSQMTDLFGRPTPKLSVLTVNNMHNMEHYGNLVTYMRLKNVVPPTSEPGFDPMPKK